ncbi:S41 family peptidase [Crossiella sp. CA198]|uniref:S41 family peptidase n=1 Tax=Crossiella sp. CA198 TaxID=3455607 RepID=UPI003F8D1372
MQTSEIHRIVGETARLVDRHYVFAEVGRAASGRLTGNLAAGRYDGVDGAAGLAAAVTADLQAGNRDLHLRLLHHAEVVPAEEGDLWEPMMRREAERTMGGVLGVRLLPGVVAHLELGPLLVDPGVCADGLVAAMNLVAGTRGLLLDLRGVRGGSPEAVALVCSYLLDERTHLNSMHERAGDRITQSWTLPHVPGPRFGGVKPVVVLTGPSTFSGGEELAYDLQHLGRARVVGERTRGGAHPREGFRVHPHLEVTVPVARAVNPVTGTNWEGVGVVPDVETSAEDAFATGVRELQAASSPAASRGSLP